MGISYKKLFHLMIDRGIRKTQLQVATNISASTLAKLGHDDYVALDVLVRICVALGCDIGDICEVTNESSVENETGGQVIADDSIGLIMSQETILSNH